MYSESESDKSIVCPVCSKVFMKDVVEEHVNKCLFLNTTVENKSTKRTSSQLDVSGENGGTSNTKRNSPILNSPREKRTKSDNWCAKNKDCTEEFSSRKHALIDKKETKPLAEALRPTALDDMVGQTQAFGQGSMLRSLLEQKKIPNMILWGPPGCGKTSLANVVANICKDQANCMRFVKLSATMSGINDVKEVVKLAKNEAQFKRQTILFMDEIHRFNKLQQDTFLPHVENGTIILIGATTENPSFSLNNALLSRCRVVVMEKLSIDDVMKILKKAIHKNKDTIIASSKRDIQTMKLDSCPRCIIEESSLEWLAEVCDGDARVALGALELALASQSSHRDVAISGPATLTLEHIKDGIKRSHVLYDRKGEEHYNIISALQKSIRASDDNAALYWTTRALHGGEDPLYIARRLIRTACEDIGLADQNALVEAVACYQGCQNIGMPECDVLLAQCAVRLARAPKSREVYHAMKRCQRSLMEIKGPLPSVPLHLRNAPTKLMKQLDYGKGYNVLHKDESRLNYMPEGMEDVNFFDQTEDCQD